MNTRELGELGEKLACEYLVKNGYKILGRNYRISFGEIDIIARKKPKLFARFDNTIHFVEVKALKGFYLGVAPEDHVDSRKQQKLRQMALIWLEKNKYQQHHPYQIDVIGILVDEQNQNHRLEYFPNAVQEN